MSGLKASLPDPLAAKVKTTAADWQSGGKMQRLWQRGATLWTGAFSRITHFPIPHLLDSTDPAQVKAFEHQIDIPKTPFIVSSKSGSTVEPNIFKQLRSNLRAGLAILRQRAKEFVIFLELDAGPRWRRDSRRDTGATA